MSVSAFTWVQEVKIYKSIDLQDLYENKILDSGSECISCSQIIDINMYK